MALDPEQEQQRLDALQRDIDEGRRDLAEEEGDGEDERRFIDPGTQGPVDDTIPPG